MADQSKRERREAAREARRVAEEQAARDAAKARVRGIGITIISVVLIGALVWLAVDNVQTDEIDAAITVDREAAAAGRDAAGCEVLAEDAPNPEPYTHIPPAEAPPASAMYAGIAIRPVHSGVHLPNPLPRVGSGIDTQLDERALTHNLEHGAIVMWFDPEQADGQDLSDMRGLADLLNDNGFSNNGGGNLYVTPYTEDEISSGKAIAIRAWGNAMDCDSFDEEAVKAFIREHYGTEGIAPEKPISPYPFGSLAYEDEVADQGDDEPTTTPTEGDDDGSMAPMDPSDAETTSDEPTATETTSDEPSDEPTATETTES